MVGFVGKRKELEQVVDGLSDFSLSGPATKSRRLDPGLPPIMEEEPTAPSMAFPYEIMGKESNTGFNMPNVEDMMESSMSPCLSSDDMALVLYKPLDSTVLFGSPGKSSSSFIVRSDVLRGLKKPILNRGIYRELEDKSPERSNSLALVPWTPPQFAIRSDWVAFEPETTQNFEVPMESEEATSMDIEEGPEVATVGFDGENLHQWQQHCMTPPSLPNTSTHVMWSR